MRLLNARRLTALALSAGAVAALSAAPAQAASPMGGTGGA